MYVRLEDHIEGHVTCCVLALILIRLLQIKLKDAGYTLSIDEIVEALNDANLVLIPNSSEKETFLYISKHADIYHDKNRKKLSKEKLVVALKKEYRPILYDIMKVQDLNPLPLVSDRKIIYRYFNVKLKQDALLVDPAAKVISMF